MTECIAVDWGTTSFRAYLLDRKGEIVDRVSTSDGIMQVQDTDFEAVLLARTKSWLEKFPNSPIMISGMITSRQGWIETPYLEVPAGVKELAANLVEHTLAEGRKIHFVTGLSQEKPVPDIMRGEETQVAGLEQKGEQTLILPGTHSKWVFFKDGRIIRFSTFMTGEVFAALTQHTILGRLIADGNDPAAFEQGVHEGFSPTENGGGILSMLFGARVLPLLDKMKESSIKDYISGLLLGAEIREAGNVDQGSPPLICGNAALAQRYEKALLLCGFQPRTADQDLAAFGLHRIAKAASLL